MNKAHAFVRAILPPNPLAKIKQEQITWLKRCDTKSLEESSKLTENRIKALQELLW
jgi:hypothetical protein